MRVPQRELRNNVSEVLRRAERGERLTITVNGRPVAELGPLTHEHRLAGAEQLRRILGNNPVDPEWAEDLEHLRAEDRFASRDPWRD